MKAMTWLKIKFAVGVATTALLVGGVATVAISQTGESADRPTSPEAAALLKRVAETYRGLESYGDDGTTFNGFVTNSFSLKLGRYDRGLGDYYRIEWKARDITPHSSDGIAWSAGKEHQRVFWNPDPRVVNNPGHKDKLLDSTADTQANINRTANLSGGAAWTIPPLFFGAGDESGFGLVGQGVGYALAGEEKIDGVACVVVAGHLKSYPDLPIRLWIGKDDLLIRKTERTTMESSAAMRMDTPEMKQLLADFGKAKTQAEKDAITKTIQMKGAIHSFQTRKPMVHTELHGNIMVNKKFSASDFAR